MTFLRELGLIIDVSGEEKLSNAAVLLFGKNPQKFFPHAVVTVTIDGKKAGHFGESSRTAQGSLGMR